MKSIKKLASNPDIAKPSQWFLSERQPSLHMWVFSQLCLGGFYAGVVFFGVVGFILILRAISYLLPEDPYAAIEILSQVPLAA